MVQFSCRYEIALCQLNACPSTDKKGAIIFLWSARWWILGSSYRWSLSPLFYCNTKENSLLMPMNINERLRYYGHGRRNVPFTLFALTKQANKYLKTDCTVIIAHAVSCKLSGSLSVVCVIFQLFCVQEWPQRTCSPCYHKKRIPLRIIWDRW